MTIVKGLGLSRFRGVLLFLVDTLRLAFTGTSNVGRVFLDAPGCREDWDDTTDVDLRVQHLVGPYPTLHAISIGPQLAELERICAESAAGKHAGESILDPGAEHHWVKALQHLQQPGGGGLRDPETNARQLIHAAARLLMAAACLDAEGAT